MNAYVITSSSPVVQLLRMLTPGAMPVSTVHIPSRVDGLTDLWYDWLPAFLVLNGHYNSNPDVRAVTAYLADGMEFGTAVDRPLYVTDRSYPLIGIFSRTYWSGGPFEKFSIIPAPQVSYERLVRHFLAHRPPRMEMLVGTESPSGDGPDVCTEPWDDSMLGRLFVYECDRELVRHRYFVPARRLVIEYDTTLDLLWDLPSVTARSIGKLDERTVIVVRFSADDWKTSHVLMEYPRRVFSILDGMRSSVYLFADTLVMLAGMLGYYRIAMNELAMLMLTWWNFSVFTLTPHMQVREARRTSVLLMQEMLRQVEREGMLSEISYMIKRYRRIESPEPVYLPEKVKLQSGKELRFLRAFQHTGLDHQELFRLWNLLRSQLGMPLISRESYLEPTEQDTG